MPSQGLEQGTGFVVHRRILGLCDGAGYGEGSQEGEESMRLADEDEEKGATPGNV
ncbi:MAG: hypothetical protein ACLSEX_08105 [Blautia sp.]